jgi:hypothetical protein
MWGREEKLVRLYEELETLYVFDRIHDYGADVRNRGDDDAYASRQKRRSEILAEIAKLTVRKPWFEGFGAHTRRRPAGVVKMQRSEANVEKAG